MKTIQQYIQESKNEIKHDIEEKIEGILENIDYIEEVEDALKKVGNDIQIMYKDNMKKNRIRLSESQLHRVIKESVKRVLNEAWSYTDMHNSVASEWAIQNEAIDNLIRIEKEAKSNGQDIHQEVRFLLEPSTLGDVHGRVTWRKLRSLKTPYDVIRLYNTFSH